jgi:FixJ family two-component response regulator
MAKREIILADTDNEMRDEMADTFRRNGYQVETTDSASHVICTVLEKHVPVVLLGNDFDKKIALNDMVRLLKNCNRHLTIILVSDEESLPHIRSIRQEGIFYHALRPDNREQIEEIRLAIECAFSKHEQNVTHKGVAAIREEKVTLTEGVVSVSGEEKSQHDKEKEMKSKAKVFGTAAALLGVAVIAIAAPSVRGDTSELAMWGFLGFCALIVVGQLLPVAFTLWENRKAVQRHAQELAATKQEAPATVKKE